MALRFVIPTGVGMAVAMGIGLSSFVPTTMVTAAPPPWAAASQSTKAETTDVTDRSPTWQFAVAPPVDLDPSLAVGPVERREDYALASEEAEPPVEPTTSTGEPVFVAVNYGVTEYRAQPQIEMREVQPETDRAAKPAQLAAIY